MATSAPASTYVLVVGVMASLSAFGTVVIFTPSWYWYLIPLALAVPEIVILVHRWRVKRQMRRELEAAIAELG